MAGALIMLWDPALGAPWPQGRAEWMGISAGFAYALSTVVTRKAADVSVAAKSLAVWVGVVALAAALIPALDLPVPRAAAPVYLGAIALGLGGILVMTLLVQYGVSHLPVHRSAVIVLVELVAAALSQQLLTDEVVHAREWAGGALIVIGAYLAARATPSPGE
jgi:drug/metabolite transporter (DMT)-like permease